MVLAAAKQVYRTTVRIPSLGYACVRFLAWRPSWALHNIGVSANKVTGFRLLASPAIFYLLASMHVAAMYYVLAVAGLGFTDAIDGVLAGLDFEKKQHSDIGAWFDPLADKVYLASIYLYHVGNFPRLTVTTVIGEACILVLAAVCFAAGAKLGRNTKDVTVTLRATLWGKTKFGFEIASAIAMTWYALAPSAYLNLMTVSLGSVAIFCLGGSLLNKIDEIIGLFSRPA